MSEEQNVKPPATYERLDVTAIAANDRMIVLPLVDGERELPIPGDISIPTMARLLILERRIDTEADSEALVKVFEDAASEILRLVRVRTPDAPEINMDAFGVKRIMGALSWLAGDASVAESFRDTLTLGAPELTSGEPVTTAHAASDEDGADVHGEDPGPLVSSDSSATHSSGSDSRTDGDRSGGESAAGERSASTSLTPTVA